MTTLWTKFTAWLSGWPEGTKEGKKIKEDQELFMKELDVKSKTKPIRTKKPKGLKPKKKNTRKQGNMK